MQGVREIVQPDLGHKRREEHEKPGETRHHGGNMSAGRGLSIFQRVAIQRQPAGCMARYKGENSPTGQRPAIDGLSASRLLSSIAYLAIRAELQSWKRETRTC